MEDALTILSWFFIAAGSFFFVVGSLGLVRMPDVFTRMHALSVAETLGVGFLLVGMAIDSGFNLNTGRLIIILGILYYTAPIATHALAQAALQAGVEPQLAEDRTKRGRRMPATRTAARAGKIKTEPTRKPAKRKTAAKRTTKPKGRSRSSKR